MIQINLLPQEMRRKTGGFGVTKGAVAGVAATVALVLMMIGTSYYQKVRLTQIEEDIARVEAKTRQMKKDIQLVDRLVNVKSQIVQRLSAIESLDRDRSAWVQNMEDLATVIPEFLWLSEFRQGAVSTTTATRSRLTGIARVNADSVVSSKDDLTLQGYSFTVSSLANFVLNLQDSPRFSHVRLNYARMTKINERNVYDFEVACHLEPVTDGDHGTGDEPAGPTQLGDDGEDADDEMYLGAVDPYEE